MATGSVGLKTTVWNNNFRTMTLLCLFPVLVFVIVMAVTAVVVWFYGWHSLPLNYTPAEIADQGVTVFHGLPIPPGALVMMLKAGGFAVGGIFCWYMIAFCFHERLVDHFAHARTITRKEYPALYNQLENLCISRGLPMPRLGIMESGKLNAFASGLNQKTYRITVTRGLIETLEPEEMEAVLAHELTHIINRDVRLMVTATIFTGILAILAELAGHGLRATANRRVYRSNSRSDNRGNAAMALLLIMVIAGIGYGLALVMRAMVSRGREYMADAGAVELTKNPEAMIRALRRISARSHMPEFDDEMRQMLFDNSKRFLGIFATHPPIDARVKAIQGYSRITYDFAPPNVSRRRQELDAAHPDYQRIRQLGLGTRATSKQRRNRAQGPMPWGPPTPSKPSGPWAEFDSDR
jgi:heat shock protein HtpX